MISFSRFFYDVDDKLFNTVPAAYAQWVAEECQLCDDDNVFMTGLQLAVVLDRMILAESTRDDTERRNQVE